MIIFDREVYILLYLEKLDGKTASDIGGPNDLKKMKKSLKKRQCNSQKRKVTRTNNDLKIEQQNSTNKRG